jgi:hypothetical protein
MLLTSFLIFMLVFSLVVLFVITSAFLGFLQTRVPFVPTSREDVEFVVKKLALGPKDIFMDLGSGDGRVCFLVESACGAKTIGFEMTWWTHLIAKFKAKIKKSKASFYCKNFFHENWSGASVVYGYLYPPLMRQVEEKFMADCKPGTFAVIRDFPFPGLKPIEVIYRPGNHEIYIYLK